VLRKPEIELFPPKKDFPETVTDDPTIVDPQEEMVDPNPELRFTLIDPPNKASACADNLEPILAPPAEEIWSPALTQECDEKHLPAKPDSAIDNDDPAIKCRALERDPSKNAAPEEETEP
jgi:hypothetical protein